MEILTFRRPFIGGVRAPPKFYKSTPLTNRVAEPPMPKIILRQCYQTYTELALACNVWTLEVLKRCDTPWQQHTARTQLLQKHYSAASEVLTVIEVFRSRAWLCHHVETPPKRRRNTAIISSNSRKCQITARTTL